jgi:hypothetical protein
MLLSFSPACLSPILPGRDVTLEQNQESPDRQGNRCIALTKSKALDFPSARDSISDFIHEHFFL